MRRFLLSSLFTAALGLALGTAVAPAEASAPGAATASPVKKGRKKAETGIKWKVAPSTVEIFVDGKKVGVAKDLKVTKTKPGMHTVRLVNGEDETEFDVMVKKGQVVELRYEFTDA